MINLDEDESYDPSNKAQAMQKLMEHDGRVTGLIYQNPEQQSYEDRVPGFSKEALVDADLKLPREKFEQLLTEFM